MVSLLSAFAYKASGNTGMGGGPGGAQAPRYIPEITPMLQEKKLDQWVYAITYILMQRQMRKHWGVRAI